MFRHGGKYWMIASGCTGWDPNEARLMTADSIMGDWKMLPNPCVGENADKTFGGQSNYVFRLPGEDDRFIAMFDVAIYMASRGVPGRRHAIYSVSCGI